MTRSIVTINDLTNDEIEALFSLADRFLADMSDAAHPYRIKRRLPDAANYIASTLFYEPSTRTRFSFESAMLRLGGGVFSFDNPATTSASKGESLADTVRVV